MSKMINVAMIPILILAMALSGCVGGENEDGFKIDESKYFRQHIVDDELDGMIEGTITWDGKRYYIDAEIYGTMLDVYVTGKTVGYVDNARTEFKCPLGQPYIQYGEIDITEKFQYIVE